MTSANSLPLYSQAIIDPRRIEVIDEAQAAIYRRMTPAQRGAIAAEMYDMARGAITMQIKRRHPDWTEEQIQKELAHRMAG